MVELYRTYDPQKAYLIQITLNQYGIESQLIDEKMGQITPHLINIQGGVKIYIYEEDFNEAKKILKEKFAIKEIKVKDESAILEEALKITNSIPLINRLKPTQQIVTIIVVIVLIMSFFVTLIVAT